MDLSLFTPVGIFSAWCVMVICLWLIIFLYLTSFKKEKAPKPSAPIPMLLTDGRQCLVFSQRLKQRQSYPTLPRITEDLPPWGQAGRWWKPSAKTSLQNVSCALQPNAP